MYSRRHAPAALSSDPVAPRQGRAAVSSASAANHFERPCGSKQARAAIASIPAALGGAAISSAPAAFAVC
jgi:hypothetical protein